MHHLNQIVFYVIFNKTVFLIEIHQSCIIFTFQKYYSTTYNILAFLNLSHTNIQQLITPYGMTNFLNNFSQAEQ